MLEKNDIQGFIKQGYAYLTVGHYVLAKITNPPAFKQWLQSQIEQVTTAASEKPSQVLNLAFTHSGLKALNVDDPALATFSREWQESIVTRERSYRLGDTQHNTPDEWEWGAPHQPRIDVLLLGFFETSKVGKNWLSAIESLEAIDTVSVLSSKKLPNSKEHFGFRDGISQPAIKGLHQAKESFNALAPGEFILGHKNEYDQTAACPSIGIEHDKHLQLKKGKNGKSQLGFNGSYLVFRQLEQDVKAFWQYADEQSKDELNKSHPQTRLLYASKMFGRWPNGKIIKPGATAQPSAGIAHGPENNFTFETDKSGRGCPIGSHIRRSNPRATLAGQKKAKEALSSSNRHRILRRGRPYGEPLASSMSPEAFLDKENDDVKRGLLFLCLNTDISRQFEFVQQTWLNNSKFRGLYTEVDPIAGVKPSRERFKGNHYTIPAKPFRKRLRQVPPFIKTRGGGYFFLPSIRALKFLSTLE